ncbi:MAG: putative oxidoreductase [Ilumatobacteraceae bacterium]|nr:putative oxidoreductase [Ilumatobacteraceae bacterium]
MKTLVVYCHPNPASFVAAARDAALDGLRAGGHEVRVTDLYADGFDPVFSAEDHAAHLAEPSAKPGVATYGADLQWCESLVLIYPTWWAGQPAMLKGWVDRVWINGVAWTKPADATRLRRGLRNVRRITVVTTHGSSKFVNALEGEAGKRTVTRSMCVLCSPFCRTRWLALYTVDRSTQAERAAFLERVRKRLAR